MWSHCSAMTWGSIVRSARPTRPASGPARGRWLGRPKGCLGASKLDGKEAEIQMLLEKEVSKRSIAKIVSVSPTALRHFIRTRKLDPKASKGRTGGPR